MQFFIRMIKIHFLILYSAIRGFDKKVVILQFMVDGVASDPGHNAQQCVEEGLRLGPEPAQILLLLMGDLNVRDKALRTGIATLTNVQVGYICTFKG